MNRKLFPPGAQPETDSNYKGAILIRRKTAAITGLLALVLGFLVGTAFPQHLLPWGMEELKPPHKPDQSVMMRVDAATQTDTVSPVSEASPAQGAESTLNTRDNFPLLNTACAVLRTIQQRDYKALAGYVDGEQGLTFTTFSTVNREIDLTFHKAQVAAFDQDSQKYNWGLHPASGERLNMTAQDYFSTYIYNVDYTQATVIGVDRVNISGNALENVREAYSGCRFVEFTFPGSEGLDWCSIKLVFTPGARSWQLVGLIHSEWTV